MPLKVKCPTCRKETQWEGNAHRPFCSDRCRLIDLGAWVDERYRIPAEESADPPENDDDENKQIN